MKAMMEIIPPVKRELLEAELTADRFVRKTNNGSNLIYIFDGNDAPNLMREVGRLRELTFRQAGGGTGKELDVDKYDLAEKPYHQLLVWSPAEREVVGGYRFIKCDEAATDEQGNYQLATSGLFSFSEKFRKDYFSKTIELGRSFVQPKFQPGTDSRKGLFSLDNIWDGLGAIVLEYPSVEYYFGKVTMYLHFNQKARDLILYFLRHYFQDKENLMQPIQPLPFYTPIEEMEPHFRGLDFKEAFKVLNTNVRALGENIPPLMNIYMNLSPTMKSFGTALNRSFGEVEETAILVKIADIYEAKKERHMASYTPSPERIKK
jgi:hypothetical protein